MVRRDSRDELRARRRRPRVLPRRRHDPRGRPAGADLLRADGGTNAAVPGADRRRGAALTDCASVTFDSPRGLSGSRPFARATAPAKSWPGTTESSGASSGLGGAGTGRTYCASASASAAGPARDQRRPGLADPGRRLDDGVQRRVVGSRPPRPGRAGRAPPPGRARGRSRSAARPRSGRSRAASARSRARLRTRGRGRSRTSGRSRRTGPRSTRRRRSSTGRCSSSCSATSSSEPGASSSPRPAMQRREERQRRELVRVRLRRGDRVLGPGRERQHRLRRLARARTRARS